MLSHNLLESFPSVIRNQPHTRRARRDTEGKERPRKEADHSRLVTGLINKETLLYEAYLGWPQI